MFYMYIAGGIGSIAAIFTVVAISDGGWRDLAGPLGFWSASALFVVLSLVAQTW